MGLSLTSGGAQAGHEAEDAQREGEEDEGRVMVAKV